MTDKEKLLHILKTYKVDSMKAILNCYLETYYHDISTRQISDLMNDLNRYLAYKVIDLETLRSVANERARYLKSYLNGDMWLTEEAARENVQPQIDNAQAIIDACKYVKSGLEV